MHLVHFVCLDGYLPILVHLVHLVHFTRRVAADDCGVVPGQNAVHLFPKRVHAPMAPSVRFGASTSQFEQSSPVSKFAHLATSDITHFPVYPALPCSEATGRSQSNAFRHLVPFRPSGNMQPTHLP